MGLRTPRAVGVSDAEGDQIRSSWETMQRVLEKLAARGITVPDQPPPFPMPEVTTTLVADDNQDYLKVNSKYLAWLNFLLPQIALVQGILLEVENEMTNIEVTYREKQRAADEGKTRREKLSAQEVADATALDTRYVELTKSAQELKQEKGIMEARQEILERTLRTISRHVEVKKLDVEMNRTGANLPHRQRFNKPMAGGQ